jgi:hypothetical protein
MDPRPDLRMWICIENCTDPEHRYYYEDFVYRYCVGIHRRVDVYSIENAGVEYTVDLNCRPNCLVFVDDNTIAIGCESPKIQVRCGSVFCLS